MFYVFFMILYLLLKQSNITKMNFKGTYIDDIVLKSTYILYY